MRATRRSSRTSSSAAGQRPRRRRRAAPARSAGARARRRPRRRAARAAPGREETTRSSSRPRNSRPTPSSAAQPPGSAPGAHRLEPDRQPLGLAVGVHGQRAGQQAEPGDRLGRPAGPRDAALEPAHRPGAEPGEHDAALPRLDEDARRARARARSRAGCASSRRRRRRRPARARSRAPSASVPCRRNSDRCCARHARPPKRSWNAAICAAGSPEAVGRNSTRGSRAARERQDEVVEGGVVGLHREAAPAHGEDRGRRAHAARRLGPPAPRGSVVASGVSTTSPSRLDAERARVRARGTTALQLRAAEVQRGAVLGRVARAHAVADEAAVLLAPLAARRRSGRSWSTAAGRGPRTMRRRAVERGQRLREPAQRAGRRPAQHDAAPPGLGAAPRRARARARCRAC